MNTRSGAHKPTQRPVLPDDTKLAWELADTARNHLSAAETSSVHIAIGLGDQFAAIDLLLTVIAREQVHADADLMATVTAWLDCYRGHDDEPRLRDLLAGVAAGACPARAPDAVRRDDPGLDAATA
ncbi:hypothetical protein [Mycobacterium sp. JS623]|uniref:hypothetical protein n=1 Tax=Mycobacterium sp. JS623 TaxID=212767 RepID=UPI0012FC884E|nr:hypothetical protein [Mycobacterium sp. JS623]